MATKLYDAVIKTGSYIGTDGNEKGRYTKLGVVMQGDNGQFMIIEPTVDLAGCLMLQNQIAVERGQPQKSSVMCSMFEPNQQGQQPQPTQQPQPMQQPQQQMQPQQPMQQPMQQQPQQPANVGFSDVSAPF